MLKGFGTPLPVYVTRPTASGVIASYELAAWMSFLVLMLLWINAVVWGLVGILTAVKVVF